MTKLCWIDTETTGLWANVHDVIQLAGIIEIDGEIKEEFEFKCQPHSWDKIQQKALDTHGYSIEDLKTFDCPHKTLIKFEHILDKYVNKYNKQDKFIFAGYNAPFDEQMMRGFFKKGGNNFFGSYFEYKLYDVYALVQALHNINPLPIEKLKLEIVAPYFGFDIKAHDALSDIQATKYLGNLLGKMLQTGYIEWNEGGNY